MRQTAVVLLFSVGVSCAGSKPEPAQRERVVAPSAEPVPMADPPADSQSPSTNANNASTNNQAETNNQDKNNSLAAQLPPELRGQKLVQGSLSKAVIRDTVRQRNEFYKRCYEQELRHNKQLAGRVMVRFVILSSGKVSENPQVSETTLANEHVERCLLTELRKLEFPPPTGGGIVIVNYPFNFSANKPSTNE